MPNSPFRTEQFTSEHFVESAGVVLIHKSSRKVCLIHHRHEDQWLLPKGRRNLAESREEAATREAKEETGYACDILPISMKSRAPPTGDDDDGVHVYESVYEAFMVTLRHLDERDVKVIWWYVAAVDERAGKAAGEQQSVEAVLVDFGAAVEQLTFAEDQEVMKRGLRLYVDTHEEKGGEI
ncbi:hypothetical protein LTR36_000876 [Oleoguttula mirabilis]|uniref:Nudix hydrolase domain-containing protein n=1 Tax=Oleoguttula mirabilis TaxID=1507867 RepID=A0AAV9J4N9_9PEZI|nr:hypothetical protein LTR36_000876 [Oleoguttula mirabilis]